MFLFQNKCLQKNNPPFTKKVATKQYTDSTVVLVRGLNLRLIRRLAPARMAIRYIPARLELQLLSLPRLLAPTLARAPLMQFSRRLCLFSPWALPSYRHAACMVIGYTSTRMSTAAKPRSNPEKYVVILKKNLGSRRPPQGRRPGAVAPPRAMVDPPLSGNVDCVVSKAGVPKKYEVKVGIAAPSLIVQKLFPLQTWWSPS